MNKIKIRIIIYMSVSLVWVHNMHAEDAEYVEQWLRQCRIIVEIGQVCAMCWMALCSAGRDQQKNMLMKQSAVPNRDSSCDRNKYGFFTNTAHFSDLIEQHDLAIKPEYTEFEEPAMTASRLSVDEGDKDSNRRSN